MLSIFKKRKLRVDILVIFVTLFLSGCLSIIVYTYVQQRQALLAFSNELIDSTEARLIDQINNYLKPAAIVELTSRLLEGGTLNLSDKKRNSVFLEGVLKSYPRILSLYVADNKGNFLSENRVPTKIEYRRDRLLDAPPGSQIATQIIDRTTPRPSETWMFKNAQGQVIQTLKFQDVTYDPRERPWFMGADQHTGKFWMGVYSFYKMDKQGISISFSLVNTKGEFLGVVATDFELDDINNFLSQQKIGKSGFAFIVDNQNNVIAYPNNLVHLHKPDKNKLSFPNAKQFHYDRMIQPIAYHQKTGQEQFFITINGVRYISSFTPFTHSFGQTWTLVIVVPVNDFIGSINATNQINLLFSTFILLLGMGLIFLVSRKISKPIVRLAKEAIKFKQLKFDDPIKIKTHIAEVQMLMDAINSAKTGLQSFSKYIPTKLVGELVKMGEVAKLGTQKKELTVMFTDIANFATTVESMPSDQLTEMLSVYFEALSMIIKKQHGTIDKYIGDAIMAFWGAPVSDEYHTRHACFAALYCKKKVAELNAKWRSQGAAVFPTRFGLNTGNIIIGNMGSSDRMNYTIIGDNVNLAARLETTNKIYGTDIIVSQYVYEKVADEFLFRPIDIVTVKGKTQPTQIYELMAGLSEDNDLAPSPEQIELSVLTTQAYDAYLKENYLMAYDLYQTICKKFPHDEVAFLYRERCKKYL
jgi:adenylate cyclase